MADSLWAARRVTVWLAVRDMSPLPTTKRWVTALAQFVWVTVQRSTAGCSVTLAGTGAKAR